MYFDTHAHYDDEAFDSDRDALLSSMPSGGISLILNPGCERISSELALDFSDKYDFMYAAGGWHPQQADEFDDSSPELIRKWAMRPKFKAIGEIGLDYFYDFAPKELQKEVFERQLELAEELNLPVIVHDRDAHGDCLEIIRRHKNLRGVFHCYSGSPEMAKELVSMGWYLSFTGAITFKNAKRSLETIAVVPNDRIMIETDSPYLAPVPNRGKRNSSLFLPHIASVIAQIKHMTLEEAALLTLENGKRFFGIL